MNAAREILRGMTDMVFPPVCLGCGGLVEGGRLRHICVKCEPMIYLVEPPSCSTCGSPFFGEVEGERMCPHCEGLHPQYGEGRTVTLFKGPARALIHELKYHKGHHVLADVEEVVRGSAHVMEFVRGSILVPVPLHPRKERERGYNQTALLAGALARAAGGTTRIEALLDRVVDTPSQTTFDRKARRANLKNAFALAKGATINPASPYILVDDVFTTGSTLNSCAGVLRRAGALNLNVVTFGHG
ncbi:double zinc ribbon domain-containing protein [Rariglobus hedericola]|uniref:ComF family protein n=1 Tax=Rariglobus hedericola TaxID=2597822 RepID=A0A556QQS3_9BACT|nr:double zinc ribbon domain-containing protein [Rariglobus hedericola]TSJ78985.1 ComF family protein [Rariglobus hedericola]